MSIALIGCTGPKTSRPTQARHLYRTALFRARLAYAEANYDAVFIVSARHGLVHPNQVIEPYDLSLTSLSARARRAWAGRVAAALKRRVGATAHVDLFASQPYIAVLRPALERAGFQVGVPTDELVDRRAGHQMCWLTRSSACLPPV